MLNKPRSSETARDLGCSSRKFMDVDTSTCQWHKMVNNVGDQEIPPVCGIAPESTSLDATALHLQISFSTSPSICPSKRKSPVRQQHATR
ncbi:hypothetical protein AVEN_89972-1 [Araneus ventricosus]|uniref:Uncharacterized protein n=1 Tax=Araneus ventricosus TaxID=182803 RepID=A0A4Y2X5W7_ARAVE|nr:hypothetical protein AVEN_19604-1 [Araneus ventricosus]GBO44506.1 hypothetical protein AVEN_233438-1 [Araneus ventricosus]GBO44512.1 hypothetical protein AVEN_89972-1 [Araneus ventricosus]